MTLLLSNDDVEQVLTMRLCMDALEPVYRELGEGRAVFMGRQDMFVPSARRHGDEHTPVGHYTKIMAGASPCFGVSAVRFTSDIVAFPVKHGVRRRIKIPAAPGGKWLGLTLLLDSTNGELLSIISDGYLMRMRVGATNGIAAKYLARPDSRAVGLIGSGWQAGVQLSALKEVRPIESVKVYSPTREHREAFAWKMAAALDIEVRAVVTMEEAAEEVDILITATNSRQTFLPASMLAPGMHVSCLQRDELKEETYRAADVLVVNSKTIESSYTSETLREMFAAIHFEFREHPVLVDVDWKSLPELADLVSGKTAGRTSDRQITAFVNNLGTGLQHAAVGARVYQLARERGLGREIPTDWFLEDIVS